MRRRFALVFNRKAGIAIPRLLDGVVQTLRRNGAEVFQLPARTAAEATEAAAEMARTGGCDAIIAAGGDGTFRAVATGAAQSELPVGVIPLGTGNVIAHELGIARRVRAVAEVLLSGSEIVTRGGLVNGAPFFLMIGAGFDARVVSRVNYVAKRAFGRGAYTYPVLKTLAEQPHSFDVELDGRCFEASWVILSLASHYGGSFVLTRDSGVGRNALTAVVIEAPSRFGIALAAMSLALGRLVRPDTRPAGIHILPVRYARIGRLSTVPVEVDGDADGVSPIEVSGEGPPVRVLVPESYVADLTNRHANHLVYES